MLATDGTINGVHTHVDVGDVRRGGFEADGGRSSSRSQLFLTRGQ
jgi:hypothetical protein